MNGNEYVEVYARPINTFDVGNPSGDEETTFAHVSWDSSGFTGSGWFTRVYSVYNIQGDQINVYGPLHNFTPEQIEQAISTPVENPNLNDEFQAWENSVSIEVRSGWIQYVANETSANNCVS